MRRTRPLFVFAAVCALLSAGPSARSDGGEDGTSTDDLLCVFRPYYATQFGNKWSKGTADVPWTDWWYANRRDVVRPVYRAGSSSAGVPRDDPKARARAREALLAALAGKDRLVASEAALALGRAGDPRDIEALAKIVADPDVSETRRLHRYAAIGLGMLPLGDAAQAAAARTALVGAVASSRGRHDQFSYFWADCAYALAMRGDVSVMPDLVTMRERVLRAHDMQHSIYIEVLGAVCYAMGALGGELALPEIEEHLEGRKAPDGGFNDSTWSATQALARVGGGAARRILLAGSRDDRKLVRAGSLQALGAVAGEKDEEAFKVLRGALFDDKEVDCRRMAAISLGRCGHAGAADTLLEALRELKGDDRPFVGLALGFLARRAPDVRISKALLEGVERSGGDDAQGSFALACGLAGVKEAIPRLAEIVEKGGPTAGPLAAFALGQLGAGSAERNVLHEAVAKSGDQLERREAALALGALHDRSVVDQLRAIVSGRSGELDRASAVVCLGRVGDDADIDLLLALLSDRDTSDQLRACVVHALGWLLDRTDYARLARIAADVKWDKYVRGLSTSWTGDAMWEIQHLVD